MKDEYRNIYKSARLTAGRTQERWAEMIGVSVEAVRQYEAGRILPGDNVVTAMVEVAGLPVLGYWHLCQKSRVAGELLPEVERLPLSEAVIGLLLELHGFSEADRGRDLMRLAKDGRIDAAERGTFEAIGRELDGIVRAAMQVKFARGAE